MPQAIVQGENHINPKDFERLLDDANQAEAIYAEGRDNEDAFAYWPPSYLLFWVGSLFVTFICSFDSLVGTITRRETNKKQKAHDRDLDVYPNIDLSLREMYEEVSTPARYGCLILAMIYLTFPVGFLYVIFSNPPVSLFAMVVGLFFVIVTPFVYLVPIITIVLPRSDIRNQRMAESITEHAEENGYDSVLVLIGDSHVPHVASHLRDAGWDVTERQSSDPTMRAWRKIRSILPSR